MIDLSKSEDNQVAFCAYVYSSIRYRWHNEFDDRPKLVSRSRLIAVVKLLSNILRVVGMQNRISQGNSLERPNDSVSVLVCGNYRSRAGKTVNVSSLDRWCFEVASTDRVLSHNIKATDKIDILLPVRGCRVIVVVGGDACAVGNGLDNLTVVSGMEMPGVVAVDQVNRSPLSCSDRQTWNGGTLQRQ